MFNHVMIVLCSSASVSSDNFGQKFGDKFSELSKLGFSMEFFCVWVDYCNTALMQLDLYPGWANDILVFDNIL